MFFEEKFTKRAQTALSFAQEFALEMGHNYIGTEHLLLGLIKEGQGIASKLLQKNGVSLEAVHQKVIDISGGSSNSEPSQTNLTPRVKRIIEMSYEESQSLGHAYVGTEHLLLALFREGNNVAVKILSALGIDVKKLYNDTIESVKQFSYEEGNSIGSDGPTSNNASNTPYLNKYGQDMTKAAQENKFDPIIGRSDVITRLIQITCRRMKNNPCLVGEPGVGKTAVVEGLSVAIVTGNVPETLRNKRIIILDLASMIAGTKYRGQFEERLKKCMEEIRKTANVIVFIDEIHTIIGAGSGEGTIDAANMVKPALSRGEIQVIGATTLKEYRKYIEKDSALERRFQPVIVEESTAEESVQILKGIRDKYEAHHGVVITDEAIETAVNYSIRYIPDRFLPDKAIDLIDEAAASIKIKSLTQPPNLTSLEEEIKKLQQEKEEAITSQEFEKAAKLRDKEQEMRRLCEQEKKVWTSKNSGNSLSVGKNDIGDIVSLWTGIKVSAINEDESERLLKLEETLHKRVIGQSEAVKLIANSIRRSRVGLRDPKRPIGSFVFLGPTGVGKTELSKALAETMFGTEDALIKIDMSEYMEKHNSSKLIGSPPGYVGHEEGGQLTERVRRRPYSVILFDEIEKADPDIFNMLLQILEDGNLTDSQGIKVDFKNTVVLMTSNLGARLITENKKLGFSNLEDSRSHKQIEDDVMSEVKKAFRPEFINRIDALVVFHKLNEEEVREICIKLINELIERLKQNKIEATFTDRLIDKISKKGFSEKYGARPLRRVIQSEIEDVISEKILRGEIGAGDKITVDFEEDKILVNKLTENA